MFPSQGLMQEQSHNSKTQNIGKRYTINKMHSIVHLLMHHTTHISNTLKGQYRLLRNICVISQFRACACVREASLLIAGRIGNGRIIDREREGLKKDNLVWDAVTLNFLMAACELSAVLVTRSVHVRPDGVPAFAKLQSSSARLSALAR